jgi:hypothetical protein
LELDEQRVKDQVRQWYVADRAEWKDYSDLMGYSYGDTTAFLQWCVYNGHRNEIENGNRQITEFEFDKRTILDKQYPEPTDREVIDADFDFNNPLMRLRYPIQPDFEYPDGSKFNVTYLAGLPLGSSVLFDDRRAIQWDKTLDVIQTAGAGGFTAGFSKSTSKSNSVQTDWGASSSVSYAFISVNASASEHTQIQEDFNHATTIDLSALAAFKLAIVYPKWFRPTLFEHKRVMDNIHDFEQFFGSKGTLLYFPSHLILVRGFKVEFTSSQDWTFDYKHKFSASGGGGLNVFGVNFGGSGSYSNEQKEHQVDVSKTKLTIADDSTTIRFVGYAVKKETVFGDQIGHAVRAALGQPLLDALDAKSLKGR